LVVFPPSSRPNLLCNLLVLCSFFRLRRRHQVGSFLFPATAAILVQLRRVRPYRCGRSAFFPFFHSMFLSTTALFFKFFPTQGISLPLGTLSPHILLFSLFSKYTSCRSCVAVVTDDKSSPSVSPKLMLVLAAFFILGV